MTSNNYLIAWPQNWLHQWTRDPLAIAGFLVKGRLSKQAAAELKLLHILLHKSELLRLTIGGLSSISYPLPLWLYNACSVTLVALDTVIVLTYWLTVREFTVREWFTCTSRCSNHTVTCPVVTVTWTTGGFSRCLDSHSTRSGMTRSTIRSILIIISVSLQRNNLLVKVPWTFFLPRSKSNSWICRTGHWRTVRDLTTDWFW